MISMQEPFIRFYLFMTCWLFLAGGCTEERTTLPAIPQFAAPDKFKQGGVNWQREERLSGSDAAVLSRFFEIQPGMAGSPAVAGTPVIYHGIQNRKRFYWMQGTVDGPLWSYVEFSRGHYQFREGTGNPYRSDAQ